MRYNKHHSKKLQEFYNNEGEKSFTFKVIEVFTQISDDDLCLQEEKYISEFNTFDSEHGCNQTKGGKGVKGLIPSEQSIEKMRETKLKGYESEKYILTNGEINGMHVLTEDEVKEIVKLLYENKLSHQKIADKYNVCRGMQLSEW